MDKLSSTQTEKASAILRAGGLVAFPTETVYGLGADACDPSAVAGIYAAKGRPSFNPLIAHVANLDMAQRLVTFNEDALKLATHFWPGPLTLVLPLQPDVGIAQAASAGLPTLAVRVPDHPVALALISAFGGPVVAPSANPSGRISPTNAQHVIDGLDDKVDAVVDGGSCKVGLESTIVGFDPDPVLLRPGGVAPEDLEGVLGKPITQNANASITAPGQLASHYAPNAKVRLNVQTPTEGEVFLGFGDMVCDLNLSETGNVAEAAENLFAAMHQLDEQAKPIAVAPIPEIGIGIAINDRLRRAAAPRD